MFTITRQDERAYNTEYQGDEKQNQQHWKKDLSAYRNSVDYN